MVVAVVNVRTAVNDDFCDCADGSDEPGTGACTGPGHTGGLFWCLNGGWKGEHIFASRVNDGVCDCCDGSDEWRMAAMALDDLRGHVPLLPGRPGRPGSLPCRNTCQELAKRGQAEAAAHRRGSEIRKSYVQAAARAGRAATASTDYGPGSAFYLLSQSCRSIHAGEYTYKICPYKSVSQDKPGFHTDLGRGGRWIQGQRGKRLVMENGQWCQPVSRGRKTEIDFRCGLSDKLLSVEEFETCTYVVEFETPAACA